jgi:hypothetical protein
MEMRLCDCSKFVLDRGYCMCMYLPALIGSSRHRTRRSSSSLFKLQPFTSFFSLLLFRSRGQCTSYHCAGNFYVLPSFLANQLNIPPS